MKPFLLKDAVNAVGGRYVGDSTALDSVVTSVTSDSRTAGAGALFVAFKGSRVDGHDFMAACLKNGAVACVTEREPGEGERPAIVVDSSLRAIGALAAYVSDPGVADFQPMNVNFGIIEPLGYRVRGKRNKNALLSRRALDVIAGLDKA